jgi:hypothetical protein
LVVAPGGKSKADMSTEWEKSGLKSMNLAKAPGKEEGDADYKVEYPDHTSGKPEIMGNSDLAEAPGMENLEMSESDLSKLDDEMATAPGAQVGDSGYKVKINIPAANNPEIDDLSNMELADAPENGSKVPSKDKTNPNFASTPGKEEGDAGYSNEYPHHTSGKKEIDNLDNMNLAETPDKGAEGDIKFKVDSEMGYNIGEGENPTPDPLTLKGIREYILENKDSEEVQKMLADLMNEGFERPSPELKKN